MTNYAANTIDRLFELYIIQNRHYLLQFPGGYYRTIDKSGKQLRRFNLESHLNGKVTVGTFAGRFFTRFITFDVDFREPSMARWVTYKIAAALDSVGVHDFAISYSGNKGYHVDIFFDKALPVDSCRRFFDFIVKLAEVDAVGGGEVEFRPTGQQGVKLPLGKHQKTGKYCGFCEISDSLAVMDAEKSAAYLQAIKKTDHALILNAIIEPEEYAYDERAAADMEDAISRHKSLETYDQSESYTLARAAERYNSGMTGPGQRHKSFLLLARLFNHNGADRVDALAAISDWFAWQKPEFYDSSREFCEKDLQECVDYVYDRDLTLISEKRDLTVTFTEIDEIMRKCPLKNQKALAYALLVHSKRWADEAGVFFMTYAQMAEAADIDERTARRQIDKIEQYGVIEIIRRDQRRKGTFIKKPNVYRMLLKEEEESGVFRVTDDANLSEALAHFYENGELRSLLTRRQMQSLFGSDEMPA